MCEVERGCTLGRMHSPVGEQPGEPAVLTVVATAEADWDADGIDVESYAKGLRELGVPDSQVERDCEFLYAAAQEPSGRRYLRFDDEQIAEAARRMADSMRALLTKREVRVIEQTRELVRLPLFYLSAPPVPNSKVTYVQTVTSERTAGWSVTVLGTGFAPRRTVRLEETHSFSAENGDRKLVFFPATIIASRVEVYENNVQIGKGHRTELEPPTPGTVYHEAAAVLSDRDWPQPPADADTELYPQESDRPSDISGHDTAFTMPAKETASSIGIEAFKVALACSVAVKRERTITLHLDLPGGVRYEARKGLSPEGIWWTSPRPKATPARRKARPRR